MFQGVNSDLEIDTPQINVNILRDQASQYGITAKDVENAFNLSYSGNLISLSKRLSINITSFWSCIRVPTSPETLNDIWLRSPSIRFSPLICDNAMGQKAWDHQCEPYQSVSCRHHLIQSCPRNTIRNSLNKIDQSTQEAC